MKKIIFLISLIMTLFSQSIGRYDIDNSPLGFSYMLYFNGFPYNVSSQETNSGMRITGNIKQGLNTIVIVPKENISNLSIRLSSNTEENSFDTNYNLKLTNGIARTITVDLENYNFDNAWESADSLSSLTDADKISISNVMDKYIDILENEKIGDEFMSFSTNERVFPTEITMALQGGVTMEKAVTISRYFATNTYMGNKRREFKKYQDYKISISPYNDKLVILESRNNSYVILMGSTYSQPGFNMDYERKYFTFFKKQGKWLMR